MSNKNMTHLEALRAIKMRPNELDTNEKAKSFSEALKLGDKQTIIIGSILELADRLDKQEKSVGTKKV